MKEVLYTTVQKFVYNGISKYRYKPKLAKFLIWDYQIFNCILFYHLSYLPDVRSNQTDGRIFLDKIY